MQGYGIPQGLVTLQLTAPLCFFGFCNLSGAHPGRCLLRERYNCFKGTCQLSEGRFWIADQPHIDRMIFRNLIGIEINVDNLCVRRKDSAQFRENLWQQVCSTHQVDISSRGNG